MYSFDTFLFKMQVSQFKMFLKLNLYTQPILLIKCVNIQLVIFCMWTLIVNSNNWLIKELTLRSFLTLFPFLPNETFIC